MDFPNFTDGRLHETELWDPRLPTFPFRNRPTVDTYARQQEREYFIDPRRYAPKDGNRYGWVNYLLWSDDFTNAAWTKSNVTTAATPIANPETGLVSRTQTITDSSAAAAGVIYQDMAVANNTATRIAYAWFVAGSSSAARLEFDYLNGTTVQSLLDFNPMTGRIISTSGGTGAVRAFLINGILWYRVSITATNNATGNTNNRFAIYPDHLNVANVGNLGVFGCVVTDGSTPGPVIPTTTVARQVIIPELDLDDPFAYLVSESDPDYITKNAAKVRRIFSRVPRDQVSYDKRAFARPLMHDLKGGTYWAVSFDGETSHLFSSRIATSGAPSTPAYPDVVTTPTPVSLGHVLVSIAGNIGTATFYADDSDSAIRAAVKSAFTSLGGAWTSADVPIIRDTKSLQIGFSSALTGYTLGALSTSDASIQVRSGGSAAGTPDVIEITLASGGSTTDTTTFAQKVRTINTGSAHGGSAGAWMAAWNGDKLVGIIKPVSASGSTLVIPAEDSPWSVIGLVVTHVAFANSAAYRYVAGNKDCDIRTTERYFMPGLTAGITTGADYPTTVFALDPIAWLLVIEAGSAYAPIAAKQGQYLGPILVNTIEEVEMADALESRSVIA